MHGGAQGWWGDAWVRGGGRLPFAGGPGRQAQQGGGHEDRDRRRQYDAPIEQDVGQPEDVLLLGADIPGLTPAHLTGGAAALAKSPAVIGPAADGGYWLLGLAAPMPPLFENITWGTASVLAETLAKLPPDTPRLETLSDLDTPEDLARWPGV